MSEQLYWEDIEVGTEITPLAKIATTQMLVGGPGPRVISTRCIMTAPTSPLPDWDRSLSTAR
jgi:hypothetical protein